MPTDLEIAQSIPLKPITEIAARIGIQQNELESYGHYKSKRALSI